MRQKKTKTTLVLALLGGLLAASDVQAQYYCPPQRRGIVFRLFRRTPRVGRPSYQAPPHSLRPAPVAVDPWTLVNPTSLQSSTAPAPATMPGSSAATSAANAPTPANTVSSVAKQEPTLAAPIDTSPPAPTPAAKDTASDGEGEWTVLFDGKELGEWTPTKFGGEGEVDIKDGTIRCDYGQYMTGVTHSGKELPTNNYEIELEARRDDGFDFFCGLTFPVDESHASFIVGGWGGSVTGISSIDEMDASENSTTGYKVFKNKQWYKVRVRVTPGRLQAWIDDENFVDEDEITGERLSTRIEVDRSKPLGVCCFDTQASFRNIRIRKVTKPAKVSLPK